MRSARRELIDVAAATTPRKQILRLRTGGQEKNFSDTNQRAEGVTHGKNDGFEFRFHRFHFHAFSELRAELLKRSRREGARTPNNLLMNRIL